MPSSSRCLVLLAVLAHAWPARAQTQAQGFAVERLYPSAPTGGWWVMDDLDLHGRLGGAAALTLGYASSPLRVSDGSQSLTAVANQAAMGVALAVTYSRWRFYLNLDLPLAIIGDSGSVGGYAFTGPSLTLASKPDTVTDPRLGVDVRIVGGPRSRFRFGVGAQLFVPNGNRADYDTDGGFRGMVRLLAAGDRGRFTYAAQLGVHIRPLDDSPTPGSPKGSELLFGVAAGAKLPVGKNKQWAVVVGPEIFGATAFTSFFAANGTALEGLLSGRIEGTRDDALQVRVKLGVGAGLYQHFGAPDWRLVVGVEIFNHNRGASR